MTAAPLPFCPIPRQIKRVARKRLEGYPAIVVTGPRQSGKTTLARILSPDRPYFSLEEPDTRAFAVEDPRGFLAKAQHGAILDEVDELLQAGLFPPIHNRRLDPTAWLQDYVGT